MDPIARTAYYCCGIRAVDARGSDPLCGDHLAERFMDPEGSAVFERFAALRAQNVANVARHRIIDDLLTARLRAEPDLPVLLLGAGFDTRAFRLAGGRWLELDNPALIARKNDCLPPSKARNPLHRVPIDFTTESLADKMAPWADTPSTVVVMEGVSMYLGEDQWRATVETLRRLLPGHTLLCDLLDAEFQRRYGHDMRLAIRDLGADFAPAHEDPVAFVASLGYRRVVDHSIVGRAVEHEALPIPPWLLNSFLLPLRDGYRVFEFRAEAD
jgi:methyltransferase (TIGR00027 family)